MAESAAVAALLVRIGADVTSFVGGVDKAEKANAKFVTSVRGGINTLGKYTAAIAAAGATAAVALVKRTMDSIDAQAKLARQLRATSVGLESARHAAKLAGLENEQFTKAARQLEIQLGEAATGTGPAADALERLGLKYEQLARMDIDQRIATINQALIDHIPAAQRASVAGDLFGKKVGGAIQELSPDAIAEARREVERLGLAVDQVDSATIERANDAISSILEVLSGMANRITVAVAPVIERIAVGFRDSAIEAEGWKNEVSAGVQTMINGAAFAADAWHALKVVVKVVADAMIIGFAAVVDFIKRGFRGMATVMEEIPGPAGKVGRALKEALGDPAQEARIVQEAWADIKASLEAPMPGESVKKFFAETAEAARLARRKVTEQPVVEIPQRDEKAEKAAADLMAQQAELEREGQAELRELRANWAAEEREEQERKEEQARLALESLRTSLMSERELIAKEHADRLAVLEDAREAALISAQEYELRRQQIVEESERKMTELSHRAMTDREKFAELSMRRQAKTIFSELAGITAGVAQHSRKMFELNKVAGIANAVLSAYEGISRTLGAYPFPINVAMAAAHAAAAFAQVQAIRSTSFNGGGGGAAPAISGSTPATPVTPVGGGGGGGAAGQTTFLQINGDDVFSGRTLRKLAAAMIEGQKKGDRFVLV